MDQLRTVSDLLARSDRSFARTQHRMRTIKFWILGTFGSLYAGSLVFSVVALVAVWRGSDWFQGDWLSYWVAFLSGAPFGMSFTRIAIWEDSRAKLFVPVAKLRQAI